MEVRPSRRNALAMRWLVDSARGRSEKTMAARLAGEGFSMPPKAEVQRSKRGKILIRWQRLIKLLRIIGGNFCTL